MQSVVAVIPHFNNAGSLPRLLDSTKGQGYAETVILDDASTAEQREAAQDIAATYDAQFIPGKENRGPGGNRNRIIENKRWQGSFLHFLDADVTLESQNSATQIQEELSTPTIGMGGGLIKNPDGSQMAWNFGPSFTAKSAVGSLAQMRLAEIAGTNPHKAERWRNRLRFLVNAWPDTTDAQRKRTFFVAEANMYMSWETLNEIGGFPPVRCHDIFGPSIEIARRGLQTVFNPNIAVTHHSNGRYSNQSRHAISATSYLIRRYGLTRFLLGGDHSAGKI